MTREDWERAGAVEYVRLRGAFRDATPDLAAVLQHRCVTIVGEPGLGKTVLAQASMIEFIDQGRVPIFVRLADFAGDLREMLRTSRLEPDYFLKPSGTDGINRAFVFDGLDEIRSDLTASFLAQLAKLIESDPDGRFVLTCRQAVYQHLRPSVPPVFEEFFPLGFDGDDVLEYARLRGLSDTEAFESELDRLDPWLEASVPFVLKTLIDVYAVQHRLEATRSENLAFVTDDLLSKRTRIGIGPLRKALQWLGLAMELYSRNELTADEAKRLLVSQMHISAGDAEETLNELRNTVLLGTSTGVRFQIRSFGEYFAARQLESASLTQILSYAQFKGSLVLNPTWQNTISYLIELDPRVRGYFVLRHPSWVLTASASVFSAVEKHEVIERILTELKDESRYLFQDEPVNHHRLARLLSPTDLPLFQAELTSALPAARANALVLLGHLKDVPSLPLALDLALDRSVAPGLRRAAFAAIALIGSDQAITRLLAAYDDSDPQGDTCLDTAGALITPRTVAEVLPALLQTDTILSAAIARMAEIANTEMLPAVIEYYLGHADAACNRRMTSYTEPVWKSIATCNNDEILRRVGRLLALWERHQLWDVDRDILNALLQNLRDPDKRGSVARAALEDLLGSHAITRVMGQAIGRLCDAETAYWLMAQNPSQEFVLGILSTVDAEVREILLPAVVTVVEQQKAYQHVWESEERERKEKEEARRQERSRRVLTETDELAAFRAFASLGKSAWPALPPERRKWLEDVVARWLRDVDALHRVTWTSPNQLTLPNILPLLGELAAHYGLRLPDDRLMIHALLGIDASTIVQYHRKQPLSNDALAEFERLLADPTLAPGATSHFIAFTQQAGLQSESIYESLQRIAVAPGQTEINRSWAARCLAESQCADDHMLALRKVAIDPEVDEVILDTLTRRQHIPTIFERLGRLLKDDDALRSAERPFPATTELNWIGSIKTQKAWGLLAELRKRLLQLELPTLSTLVESTLASINKKQLIVLVEEQLGDTPHGWREFAQNRMVEYARELQFERALETTFDDVLSRLMANSVAFRAKLLCEGPTDTPTYRTLLSEGILNTVVVQPIYGWKNVLSAQFDVGPLLDGFQHVILVLDGDRGRDWKQPGHPLNADAQRVIAKLGQAGVQVHILERYGIENYFSREAFEAVLGRDLGAFFPLDPFRPVKAQIAGYDKALNQDVVRRMKVDDFRGTDLVAIVEVLAKRVMQLA